MEKSIILDAKGNPLTKYYRDKIASEPQTAKIAGLSNIFEEHPSHRLTPQRLVNILNEAEQGNLALQADLFRDMEEKDAHLFAEMQKRKSTLLTLDYRINNVRNATPEEIGYAQYIAEFLEELEDFDDLQLNMADAIGQGFSNIEMSFNLINGERYPNFEFRPQSWFQLDKNNRNNIVLRTEDGKGQELRPLNWIQHRHNSRSGYVARGGLMRTLAWPYIYRNFGIQSLSELLGTYGIPIRIGKFPEGTTEKDRNMLMRAVNEIGRYAGGIIPKEMIIEIMQAANGSDAPFMSLSNWAEKSMSKAILGSTLTTQADGKTSTNALGVIHNEVRKDLLITDAKRIAITLRRDLFYTMLMMNRNPAIDPRRVPIIEFYDPKEEVEQETNEAGLKNGTIAALKGQSRVSYAPLKVKQPASILRDKIDIALSALLNQPQGNKPILDILSPMLPLLAKATTEKEIIAILKSDYFKMNIAPLNKQLADVATITQMLALTE